MARGVVLEVQGQKAIVVVEGAFQRIAAAPGTQVGDEIEVAVQQAVGFAWRRWVGVTAAAVIIGVIAPLGWNQYSLAQPVALISVDINPSLQVTVNKQDTVLTCQALNADGAAILTAMACTGRPVADVIKSATRLAVQKGYLKAADSAGAVVVAVAPVGSKALDNQVEKALEQQGRGAAQAELAAQGMTAQAVSLSADAKERDAAQQAGISVGRYVFFQALQQKAPDAVQQAGLTPKAVADIGPGKTVLEINSKLGLHLTVGEVLGGHGDDDHDAQPNKSGNGKGQGQGAGGQQGSSTPPITTTPGNKQGDQGDKGGKGGKQNSSQGDQGGNQGNNQGDKNSQGNGREKDGAIQVTVPLPSLPGVLPSPFPGGNTLPGWSGGDQGNGGKGPGGKGDKSKGTDQGGNGDQGKGQDGGHDAQQGSGKDQAKEQGHDHEND